MHRSNRIHLLLGILFLFTAGLLWLWTQDVDKRIKTWAMWSTVAYGALAGFLAWLHGLRYSRLIDDIPTSRIASAAQGYAEILGRAVQYEDQQAKALLGLPVLWYRRQYAVRAASAARPLFPFNLVYTPIETEESQTPFAIDDGTGTACLLPHGAEIISRRRDVRYDNGTRVVEEQILPGDMLYVVGQFSSYSQALHLDQAAIDLTKQWERDPVQRGRFDRDRDGRLDQKEWLAMHDAAGLHVIQRKTQTPQRSPHHLMFKPDNGQAFLISSVPPAELAGRYRFYLVLGLALFLSCGAIFASFLTGAQTF